MSGLAKPSYVEPQADQGAAQEVTDFTRYEIRHDGRDHADPQAVIPFVQGGDAALGLGHLLKNSERHLVQAFARRGQPDGSTQPLEQRSPQIFFEPLDLLRERRLRNAKLFRCAGKAAGANNRTKIT